MTTDELIQEFFNQIDEIFGSYLDASVALKMMGFKIETEQKASSQKLKLSVKHLDSLPHIYGEGNPNDPNCIILHECTQGEFKERIKEGGGSHIIISHVCITQIYQYWEDHYRGLIAQSIGKKKEELKSDVFGDLRIYRNSIIHNRGIATSEIRKCKVLNGHEEGEPIVFTDKQIQEIIISVKTEINNFFFYSASGSWPE